MKKISPTTELNDAIQLLEAEKAVHLELMREQFHLAYESLKPARLIQNTIKEISSSPYLVDNLVSTTVGLLTGYLSKTAIAGKSDNKLRKFFGTVIQFGITNIIAKNPKIIKSIGEYISQHIFQKEQ